MPSHGASAPPWQEYRNLLQATGHMTDCSGNRALASRLFRFYVGPCENLFTVHEALVAYHSQPLRALVRGGMLESSEGMVHLVDEDVDTFVRFAEYVYRADYTPAEPDILLEPAAQAERLDALFPFSHVDDVSQLAGPDDLRAQLQMPPQPAWQPPVRKSGVSVKLSS